MSEQNEQDISEILRQLREKMDNTEPQKKIAPSKKSSDNSDDAEKLADMLKKQFGHANDTLKEYKSEYSDLDTSDFLTFDEADEQKGESDTQSSSDDILERQDIEQSECFEELKNDDKENGNEPITDNRIDSDNVESDVEEAKTESTAYKTQEDQFKLVPQVESEESADEESAQTLEAIEDVQSYNTIEEQVQITDSIQKNVPESISSPETEIAPILRTDAPQESVESFIKNDNVEQSTKDLNSGDASQDTDPPKQFISDEEEQFFKNRSNVENINLDSTDINLIVALGYEKALTETIGFERVEKAETDFDSNYTPDVDSAHNLYTSDGNEYNDKSERDFVKTSYAKELKSLKIRLFGTLALTLLLFIYDNFGIFGGTLGKFMNPDMFPTVNVLLSLQLLVFCIAISYKQLYDGLIGIKNLKPITYSLSAVLLGFVVIYDIFIAVIAPVGEIMLYNFYAAFCLVMSILSEYLEKLKELHTFNVISSEGTKLAFRAQRRRSKPSADDEDSAVPKIDYSTEKVHFVGKYFQRTLRRNPFYSNILYSLIIIFIISVTVLILSLAVNKTAASAFNSFIVTFIICVPTSYLFIFNYTLYNACARVLKNESAIIGDTAVHEYLNAGTIYFDDTDVFGIGDVKAFKLTLFHNNEIYDVLYSINAVFSTVGGPLSNIFSYNESDVKRPEEVRIIKVSDDGLGAIVDSSRKILIGSASFMRNYKIKVSSEDDISTNTDFSAQNTMFVAINGVLSAKMTLQYKFSSEFEKNAAELISNRIGIGIKTLDPNITEEFISLMSKKIGAPIKIAKPHSADFDEIKAKSNSGIITNGKISSLINAFSTCFKIERIVKLLQKVSVAGTALGAMLSILFTASGLISDFYSVYIVLYQLIWLMPTVILSKLLIY